MNEKHKKSTAARRGSIWRTWNVELMLAGDQQIFLLYRISWTTLRFRQNSSSVNIQTKLLQNNAFSNIRCITAILKWLSKVIIWLQLLRLIIDEKVSRQFLIFNQREAKPKSITLCRCDFPPALSKLRVNSRNFDWSIALFSRVVIGHRNNLGTVFFTVVWKPLY